ncbi:hypothetical protein ADICYQ_0579 [Cyclobacterium qasimii M12-11B]|uniref:Uncharacterized protein n=1 Tax=Cyclobacterium qasimii M12-11B TaxID=641524 RepID=S7WWM6_9BACT|nr:hypothetical protein ADICYQ_0579 [Cyclobacterium qasimii M12-11B]
MQAFSIISGVLTVPERLIKNNDFTCLAFTSHDFIAFLYQVRENN